jgi:hypothetical protein
VGPTATPLLNAIIGRTELALKTTLTMQSAESSKQSAEILQELVDCAGDPRRAHKRAGEVALSGEGTPRHVVING